MVKNLLGTGIFHRCWGIIWGVWRVFCRFSTRALQPFLIKAHGGTVKLEQLGTLSGGWTIPVNLLRKDSICYCIGVGANISFDIALVSEYHCKVFSFDPTPSSIEYMKNLEYDRSRLQFLPYGIWDEDREIRFYSPAEKAGCHSVYDLHGTGKYFIADCRRLSTIMEELGHESIDLLKLDIEGAWHNVVQNIVDERLNISILCVELDSPTSIRKTLWIVHILKSIGLLLIHAEKDNYLFVKKDLLNKQ